MWNIANRLESERRAHSRVHAHALEWAPQSHQFVRDICLRRQYNSLLWFSSWLTSLAE